MKRSTIQRARGSATYALLPLLVSPFLMGLEVDPEAGPDAGGTTAMLLANEMSLASDVVFASEVPFSSNDPASDDPTELSWRALAALDYRTGEMSDQLRDLVGKPVKIPGFTVPLEDFASSATEFLLVPYVGACVHTPPPPPNQLVYVEMDQGKRATMDGWNPVWLEGILHVEDVSSVYGSSSYRVVGTSVRPYE